ncbi:putative RNA-directed DNA polymerase from transposon X-element [Trichonephila clavipes]|nr:putative RNA-directed DNA polymerase from transposon X-element [Trichonephila clavipes]
MNNFLSTSPTTLIEPALPDEIIHYIKHVNAKKAPGKDLISNRMLKNFPIKLILILTILINKILKFNHFPDNWKVAIIFPINKPGKDPHLASSYRPISLLSTVGRNSHLSIENKVLLYTAVMRPILAYASRPPGQPIGVTVHCTQQPIREQSLSSQPSQKLSKFTIQTKHRSHASRIPSTIQSPSCHLAECKTPLSPCPSSKTCPDMGLRTVLTVQKPKKQRLFNA